MSYDAEVAKRPLTGEAYDILILQERGQRHMIGDGELTGFYIMPSEEYCELRDTYKKTDRRAGSNARIPHQAGRYDA